jgi:hypothetical protein
MKTNLFERLLAGQALPLALKLIACASLLGLSTYSNAQERTATMNHPGWIQIPGELIRPDCVHEIPNGARVETANGQATGDVTLNGARIAHYDACLEGAVITRPRGRTGSLSTPPGTGNGWVEASQWEVSLSSTDNISSMGGGWTVPSYPSSNGALIYLFNGIEPSIGNWILQPVLQYGWNGAFGGNYWVIASWFVGPNNYVFHSAPAIVYPGNSIYGLTQLTGIVSIVDLDDWVVSARDGTTGASSSITVAASSAFHWNWAYAAVLEAYNVTSCSEFPSNGKAVFANSVVTHGFPSDPVISPQGWYGAYYSYGGPICGFSVGAAGSTFTLSF